MFNKLTFLPLAVVLFGCAAVVVVDASSKAPSIDLSPCGLLKGCRTNPNDCSSPEKCTQMVTWRVSPVNSSYVRFEMASVTNYTKKEIDYIAFGLSVAPDKLMKNTSVIACAFNQSSGMVVAYLSHNADYWSTVLSGDLATDGLVLVSSKKASNFIECVVDRMIEPSPQQMGLSFPLDRPWTPAFAAGPTNASTGLLEHHVFKQKFNEEITLTDFDNGTTIDVSKCNDTLGCVLNPPDCKTFEDCHQIVTWSLLEPGHYVRFQMATLRPLEYIAFGLSVGNTKDDIMGNTSVLACAYNKTSSTVMAFNAHNRDFNDHISDHPELGLRPQITAATSTHIMCTVDRAVKPDPSLNGIIFPLDESWYPVWATGQTKDGLLQYHYKTKQHYPDSIVVTKNYSPPDPPVVKTTTAKPPSNIEIDLTTCDKGKGCYRNPPDCMPSSKCTQIVTWTISPKDPTAVRFEMATVLNFNSETVEYIAFGLTNYPDQIMMNSSILVCAINQTAQHATAYLSHNANRKSTPLPPDQFQVGIDLISSEVGSDYVLCRVDRKIMPAESQLGYVFPLYESYYPAVAVGETDITGHLHKHEAKILLDNPVTVTDYSNQTSIDVSLCGVARTCLLNPPGCKSLGACKQVVTWNALQSGDYVRIELATTRDHNYIAFNLANSSSVSGFMGNGSVLACVLNDTDTNMLVYHSHNHAIDSGYTSTMTDHAMAGISPVFLEANNDKVMCVVEMSVQPDPSLAGVIFPLDMPWYPAWATGPTKNGLLTYHGHGNRMPYTERVVVSDKLHPKPPEPQSSIVLKKKLHGVLMIFGWMVFIACSVLTPRYLRQHWTYSGLCGAQLWFVVHRALMLVAIACIIASLVLVFDAEDFIFVVPDDGYPIKAHPYLGLTAVILLFINPLVALLRCNPDHKLRKVFNIVHGLIGAGALVIAAANLIIGVMMFSNTAQIPIYAWIGLHGLIEIIYLIVWYFFMRQHTEDQQPLAPADKDQPVAYNNSGNLPAIGDGDLHNGTLFKVSTGIFVVYVLCSVGLAIAGSVLLFES